MPFITWNSSNDVFFLKLGPFQRAQIKKHKAEFNRYSKNWGKKKLDLIHNPSLKTFKINNADLNKNINIYKQKCCNVSKRNINTSLILERFP